MSCNIYVVSIDCMNICHVIYFINILSHMSHEEYCVNASTNMSHECIMNRYVICMYIYYEYIDKDILLIDI